MSRLPVAETHDTHPIHLDELMLCQQTISEYIRRIILGSDFMTPNALLLKTA